jgi:dynein assembly factor 2
VSFVSALTDAISGGAVFARERREISRSGRAKGSSRDPHETPTAMDQARGSLEDLNLTKEEVDKFQNAFKDEAFKKMFAEYAAEIADPKNKAESDAYLRQLEMEGKIESVYGKDVQLVMPKAGFVAKTFDEGPADDGPSTSSPDDRGSGASSSDARKTGRKAFVNVCRSDKCEDATSEKRPGGLQWSVPHTLGQPHEEKDKAGETCVAYDFCVSEHTYELTRRDERLKKMVVETAIEAVNRAFGTRLSLDFTTPKKTFVGPKTGPGVQAIKGGGKAPGNDEGGGKATSAGAPGGRVAPSRGPGAETKASAFRFGDAVAGEKRPARAGPEPEPAGECEPKHTIVHREDGKDMSKQFGTGSASREAEKRRDTRPSALVLRVHLPKLDSVAAAELDVGDSRVFFRVPGKYKLDLALPYEVFGDEGRAKFDKAARKLEVTLPVRPAPRAPAPAFAEPVETIADSAEARDEAVPPDAVNPAAAPDDAEARAAASAAAAVAAAAAFDAQGETENQRRWREAHEAREKEAREKETDEARASASNAAATNGDEREDDDATPFSVGDEKASSSEIGAAKKSAAAATFLRPSLRGAAELGDELD